MAVYFIRAGKRGPIKIGYSWRPTHRLLMMQPSNPQRLFLLGEILGGRLEEQRLHLQFDHLLIGYEWFKAAPELLRFVRTATKGQASITTDDLSRPGRQRGPFGDYMRENRFTAERFAARHGLPIGTVFEVARGGMTTLELARRIAAATKGKVKAEDLHNGASA